MIPNIILRGPSQREYAKSQIDAAPADAVVSFAEPRRNHIQNERMWAMLSDIADQKTHCGLKLSKEDWKLLFLDALGREKRVVPNLDNNGLVSLSGSSSKLSVREMSELIEILFEWGARNDVRWKDPTLLAARAA